MPSLRKVLDEAIVAAVRHVVQILNADDLRNGLGLGQLARINVAETEMANESLLLQLGEYGQRFFDGPVRRPHHPANPKIDDIERVAAQISQIVMNGIDKFLPRKSCSHDLSSPRRAPTLVTITRPSG